LLLEHSFFEHTIFTLGYTNVPDKEHFGVDFFASLHRAKLFHLFYYFFIDYLFFNNYICKQKEK